MDPTLLQNFSSPRRLIQLPSINLPWKWEILVWPGGGVTVGVNCIQGLAGRARVLAQAYALIDPPLEYAHVRTWHTTRTNVQKLDSSPRHLRPDTTKRKYISPHNPSRCMLGAQASLHSWQRWNRSMTCSLRAVQAQKCLLDRY